MFAFFKIRLSWTKLTTNFLTAASWGFLMKETGNWKFEIRVPQGRFYAGLKQFTLTIGVKDEGVKNSF